MSALGESTAAAVFDNRDDADEAWSLLADAGIPSTVITDPGMLGAYRVEVVVDRSDLEAAQKTLASFINSRRPSD
jgi:hypothetical protein